MNTSKSEKSDPLDHETYLKEREVLCKYRQSNYDNFDKAILTLSAAFLAFSLSFVGIMEKATKTPPINFDNKGLLILSWICFAASVTITLFNFLVSILSYDRELEKIDKATEQGDALSETNVWVTISNFNYVISGLCFVAGIASLMLFCWRNLGAF